MDIGKEQEPYIIEPAEDPVAPSVPVPEEAPEEVPA